MDWCKKTYRQANHHPVAAFADDRGDTIVRLQAKAGQAVLLDASASTDPDGDKVEIFWWIYEEAGTCTDNVDISSPRETKATIVIPAIAAGKQIHVILEVKDKSAIASLYDYRRIVIDVTE